MNKTYISSIVVPIPRKRMMLFFLLGWFMMTPLIADAQQIDISGLVERKRISCHDISLTMTELIPSYHRDNQRDTLWAMLTYWQGHCGGPEPMVRFHILYQIQTATFTDDWYPDNQLDLLGDYRGMVETNLYEPFYYDYFQLEYISVDPGFSAFTTNLASYLKRYTDLQPIERFFLMFYSRNFESAMEMLRTGQLQGTRLDAMHRAEQDRISKMKHRSMGIYAGTWRPNGNLAAVGNKAQIGFFMGSVKNRLVTNFQFAFGFLNAPEEYFIVHDNMLYGTQSYLGVHLGFDLGAELVKTQGSALIPFVGIGIEGFEAFSTYDQENYGLSKIVGSLNFNIGLEYRIKTSQYNHLGLQARYHAVNYQNRGGTDLSGNAVSFGISLGFGH